MHRKISPSISLNIILTILLSSDSLFKDTIQHAYREGTLVNGRWTHEHKKILWIFNGGTWYCAFTHEALLARGRSIPKATGLRQVSSLKCIGFYRSRYSA